MSSHENRKATEAFEFTVYGRPVPAVRTTQNDQWKPQAIRYNRYKRDVGWSAKAAGARVTKKHVTIEIKVFVYGQQGDWDNYAKSICDGLNGITWIDDRQVMEGSVRKFSCTEDEQRAEVAIREVG